MQDEARERGKVEEEEEGGGGEGSLIVSSARNRCTRYLSTSAGTRIQHVPRPDRYFRYSHGSGSAAIKTADNTGPILENRLTIFSLPLPNPCNSPTCIPLPLAFALFLIPVQGAAEFVVGRF